MTGNSLRIGISGPPGVGKSTFIETFGLFLIAIGYFLFTGPLFGKGKKDG